MFVFPAQLCIVANVCKAMSASRPYNQYGRVGGWVGGRNLSLHSDSDHCLMQVCVWVCARAGGV